MPATRVLLLLALRVLAVSSGIATAEGCIPVPAAPMLVPAVSGLLLGPTLPADGSPARNSSTGLPGLYWVLLMLASVVPLVGWLVFSSPQQSPEPKGPPSALHVSHPALFHAIGGPAAASLDSPRRSWSSADDPPTPRSLHSRRTTGLRQRVFGAPTILITLTASFRRPASVPTVDRRFLSPARSSSSAPVSPSSSSSSVPANRFSSSISL